MPINDVPLVTPPSGALAFELRELEPMGYSQWQQLPAYSVLWIQQGTGHYDVAVSKAPFTRQTLLFFSVNQPFRLTFEPGVDVRGVALHFEADFYGLEPSRAELLGREGLFNPLAEPVAVRVGPDDDPAFASVVAMLRHELQSPALAQPDMLASCLRILLIRAARLRRAQAGGVPPTPSRVPAVLQQLEALIERHYCQKHTPADYADLLQLSPKALGKLTRTYYRRTLTELIQGRIVVEAKRALYLTDKSVKEIAFALGFSDQYYFSRFFKHTTSFAPQQFRRAAKPARTSLGLAPA